MYKHHIFVCTNVRPADDPRKTCRGADLHEAFKESLKRHKVSPKIVRANKSGCLDKCELGPTVVIYPEGVWYGSVSAADVDEIVESHIIGGILVERLRIR